MKRGDFMINMTGNFYNTSNMNFTYPEWNRYYNNAVYGQSSCYCKKSFFRVLNTYNSRFDIQVNDIIMAESLKTGDFTRYAKFVPGSYEIKIYESGEPRKLIFKSTININSNLAYTGIITEDDLDKKDISVLMIPEAKEGAIKGTMSSLKFTNLVLEAPDIEIVTSDGTILFSGINYGEVSNNVAVPSGKYDLSLRDKKSKNSFKTLHINIEPKMHYTLFASGNFNTNTDVNILVPEDGVNYLELC